MGSIFRTVFFHIGFHPRFHRVVDDDAAVDLGVVESCEYLSHRNERTGADAEILIQFFDGGLAVHPFFHPVHRYDQPRDGDIGGFLQQRQCFTHRGARRDHVFRDDHAVAVFQFAAHHVAAFAVIFGFLAVEAVTHILAVERVQGNRGGGGQGDAFVGRAEQRIHFADALVDAARIRFAQPGCLRAGAVVAGVDEIGRLAPAFGHKIPKGEDARPHHKGDEIPLVLFDLAHRPVPFLSGFPACTFSRFFSGFVGGVCEDAVEKPDI